MGMFLPHRMLLTYNVDEAIETLPIAPNKRQHVEIALMEVAPKAYQAPGVSITTIWHLLPDYIREALNEATQKAYNEE